MDLILWRHADADSGYPDAARALTPRGREQAEKMALWLSRRLPPDTVVLVSPALRARQTAEPLGREFRTEPLIGVNAAAPDVLEAARWSEDLGTVLVVGHQPTLGRVAALALSGEQEDWEFEKAAVWWLSRSFQGVSLRASITPELI